MSRNRSVGCWWRGALTAVLESGNLRDIRYGGVEVLRAINYLARDTSWGTYTAELSELRAVEGADQFRVAYNARCTGPEGRFDYDMTIIGQASGTLELLAEGVAATAFPTNRAGFVLLHPAEAAGSPLTIRHSDGSLTQMRFPDRIDPGPPALDIAAMTHHPTDTLTAHVTVQGDAFEMEDQRNWGDASFKTFVRPLSKPRSYTIPKGSRDTQAVMLRVSGPPQIVAVSRPQNVQIVLAPPVGVMPQMALFCDRDTAFAGDPDVIGKGIANLIVPRWQAGMPQDRLLKAVALAAQIGADIAVEAILAARDPAAEAHVLLGALDAAGLLGVTLLIAPSRELRTSPPGTLPEGEATIDALVNAVRDAGHKGCIGAGTPSYFAEFNRNPPGPAADVVYFGGSAIIHAADDASVVETIGITPAILISARHLAGDRPIWFGPCTLAMRHTPYGASLAANPNRTRIPVAGEDPRHFALFGAANGVGLAAHAAGRAACLTLAAPFGPFGLVAVSGRRTALHAVQHLLAGAAGCPAIAVEAGPVTALGWQSEDQIEVLAANLSANNQGLILPAGAGQPQVVTVDGGWQDLAPTDEHLVLQPYRTVRFRLAKAPRA
jgi:D-apionolactonase